MISLRSGFSEDLLIIVFVTSIREYLGGTCNLSDDSSNKSCDNLSVCLTLCSNNSSLCKL
jgi:hypothetical protein